LIAFIAVSTIVSINIQLMARRIGIPVVHVPIDIILFVLIGIISDQYAVGLFTWNIRDLGTAVIIELLITE